MSLPSWLSNEPAVWIALVDAVLVLAVTFGLPLSAEQKGAVDAVLAAVAGILIRSQVVPVAKLSSAASAPQVVPPTR